MPLCHLFDEPTVAQLVARLASVLAPGGRLAIIDALADDPHTTATARAVYELGLTLRTEGGQLHSNAACRRWMTEAGLTWTGSHASTCTDEPLRTHLLVGRRPG